VITTTAGSHGNSKNGGRSHDHQHSILAAARVHPPALSCAVEMRTANLQLDSSTATQAAG
jgi:hypothetical protein